MELTISRYVTAVDGNDPKKGNHMRYIVTTKRKIETSVDNLNEFELIEFICKRLSE